MTSNDFVECFNITRGENNYTKHLCNENMDIIYVSTDFEFIILNNEKKPPK